MRLEGLPGMALNELLTRAAGLINGTTRSHLGNWGSGYGSCFSDRVDV